MDLFGGFLGNDSAFGRLMTKCGTIFALNLLFVLSCIPFFTIGAAFAALYHAVFDMLDTDKDTPFRPFRSYWQGFRNSFLQATAAWLLFAGLLLLGYTNLSVCASVGGWFQFLSAGVIAVMIAALVMIVYLFPVIAVFSGKLRDLLKLSVCAAVSHPLQTILFLILHIGPPLLFFLDEINRPTYAFAGTFFWFALAAYVTGKRLLPQFAAYLQAGEAAV